MNWRPNSPLNFVISSSYYTLFDGFIYSAIANYLVTLCVEKRGLQKDMQFIGKQVSLSYEIPMNEVYKNVVQEVPHEHIMFIHITSPLIKVSTLQSCIDKYRKVVTFKHNDYDSLATVTAMHKFMWYEGKPINYEPDKMPHSYDLPDYYVLNFAVNILPKEMLVERKNIIGDKIYPFYLDEVESFDIDNQIEFDIAKTIYESGILDE